MGRFKNALREHSIAPYDTETADTPPEESAFLPLETYITNIVANNTEETEENAYYHGDGSNEVDVLSVAKGYDVEGDRFYGDDAQDLIADMEGNPARGLPTKVWHKVKRADGKASFTEVATVSAIVTDGGEAGAYETFSCTITYDKFPEKEDLVEAPEG